MPKIKKETRAKASRSAALSASGNLARAERRQKDKVALAAMAQTNMLRVYWPPRLPPPTYSDSSTSSDNDEDLQFNVSDRAAAVHGQESEVLEYKADTMRDELFVPYESTESDTSEEFCDAATHFDSSVGDSDSEVQPEAVQLLLTPAPPHWTTAQSAPPRRSSYTGLSARTEHRKVLFLCMYGYDCIHSLHMHFVKLSLIFFNSVICRRQSASF